MVTISYIHTNILWLKSIKQSNPNIPAVENSKTTDLLEFAHEASNVKGGSLHHVSF